MTEESSLTFETVAQSDRYWGLEEVSLEFPMHRSKHNDVARLSAVRGHGPADRA